MTMQPAVLTADTAAYVIKSFSPFPNDGKVWEWLIASFGKGKPGLQYDLKRTSS